MKKSELKSIIKEIISESIPFGKPTKVKEGFFDKGIFIDVISGNDVVFTTKEVRKKTRIPVMIDHIFGYYGKEVNKIVIKIGNKEKIITRDEWVSSRRWDEGKQVEEIVSEAMPLGKQFGKHADKLRFEIAVGGKYDLIAKYDGREVGGLINLNPNKVKPTKPDYNPLEDGDTDDQYKFVAIDKRFSKLDNKEGNLLIIGTYITRIIDLFLKGQFENISENSSDSDINKFSKAVADKLTSLKADVVTIGIVRGFVEDILTKERWIKEK